jgi:transposase-like protein
LGVAQRATRRRFSAAYKLKIVVAADACTKPGEIGALLRGEGLYSSLLTEWRRARDSGALGALEPCQRGLSRPAPIAYSSLGCSVRALADDECAAVLQHFHSPRFVEAAPAEVWATLLPAAAWINKPAREEPAAH